MMEIKRCLAVSLAMWLVFVAFVGMTASALPNHLMAGGVFGPGGDMSSGPSNPANAVGMVFYSTNQPSYPLIPGADSFAPATGTEPAVFAVDVGNVWDWANGDTMVTVYETTQGVGVWTGANHTTSSTTVLAIGSAVQDMGNATLEPFPVLALSKGPDWASLSWSPLIDAGSNAKSYKLYRAPSPSGPFVAIQTITHSPGVKSYNDTGLAAGPECYQLSVNYRRDDATALYETVGRSAMMCTVITGVPPRVLSHSPMSNEPNVPVGANIVVNFSEAMDDATVTTTITPSITLTPIWSVGNTVLTLTHATPFALCQSYRVDVIGKDLDGNDLVPTPTTWSFIALCDKPFIMTTNPADGAVQVRANANIIITFSEAMNTATVTYPIAPAIPLTFAWTVGNTVLTLSHTTPFANGTRYQVTVTGQDMDGNALIGGTAPNPWNFTTNTPPTAAIDPSDTLVGACCNGGSGLVIPWTMDDVETPVGQLIVWLNYTMGANSGTIAGPLTGRINSDAYTWPTPIENASVTIWLTVIDGAGDSAQDSSASVIIDSAPPSVQSVIPSQGSAGVPTDSQVVITFSEPMQETTVEVFFTPVVANLQLTWTTNATVTVGHALFQASTPYTLTVNATARDACTPGNQMGTPSVTSFTTGAGPKTPMPPANLAVSSKAYNSVVLTWTAPTQWTDLSALAPSDITRYKVYRATSATGQKVPIGNATTTTYTDNTVAQETTYYYWVTAVNVAGTVERESNYSNQAQADVPKQGAGEGEFPWIYVIIVLIVILLMVGLLLVFLRKKPAEAVPAPVEGEEVPTEPEAAPEEAPPAETPPEEAPPEETPESAPEEGPGGQ